MTPALLAELEAVQAEVSRLAIRLTELSRRLSVEIEDRPFWAFPPGVGADRCEGTVATDCPPIVDGGRG